MLKRYTEQANDEHEMSELGWNGKGNADKITGNRVYESGRDDGCAVRWENDGYSSFSTAPELFPIN